MKTFAPGLSDSIAGVLDEPTPCPHCQSSSQIAGGLCVGCLLEAGLDPADDAESETLTDILAEVRLPDQNWRLGNYEILEEIGRGGMGVIYRARQRHSRRIVAVKRVLSYHADSRETLARFRREAQAAASLDHPNILPIFEVSESEDGLPFFSMKFAPGGTLQQVAPAIRKDPRQCVALAAKITRAVQYAHSRGILHRDLKPRNILLDARGEPLVSDFGLAKWLDTSSDLTRTLTIFGTPGYIAPEQASSAAAELKPTADIYSLGAILFDLLAGRPPFLGAHALSVIRQAAESPAPKLRTLSKLADRDLETICSRCLERDPKLRYPSAHDLAEDLERWLQGRSIIARPVSLPVKVWRWSRRNPRMASAFGACAIFAAVAITWQIRGQQLSGTVREQTLGERSIAVLPFLDLDRAVLDPVFGSKVAAGLDAALSQRGPVRILSAAVQNSSTIIGNTADIHNAARSYKCRTVLSGTYLRVGDGTEFSVRLTDAEGNLLFRTNGTMNPPGGIIQIGQDDVTEVYALLVQKNWDAVIAAQEDPAFRNERSRDFLLAGRELTQRQSADDLAHASDCFRKAIDAEPKSVLARTEFARAVTTRTHYQYDAVLLALATTAAHEAAALDPLSGEAHRALASVLFHTGRPIDSLHEILRFIQLNGPDVPAIALTGSLWRILGHPEKALAWFTIMAQWQRRPAEDIWIIGDCWTDLGDNAKAEAIYRRASELYPHLPDGWVGLSHLKLLNGDFEGARALCAENKNRHPDSVYPRQMAAQIEFFSRNFSEAAKLYEDLLRTDPAGGSHFYGATSYQSVLGRILSRDSDQEARRTLLAAAAEKEREALTIAFDHPEPLYRLAAIEASQNRIEDAIGHLIAAKNAGWLDYQSMRLDPRFDSIRLDSRFLQASVEMEEGAKKLQRQIQTPP
jgi:tetratricopeptide (TPR) repeat protein/tRNA A-37 threonylcarbamoyl transferase component Bud32